MSIPVRSRSAVSPRVLGAGLAALSLAAVTMVSVAAPAGAATILSDSFKITAQEVDFGDGNFTIWDRPADKGDILVDVTAGLTTVEVDGRVYINNAAGTCARMLIQKFDINGRVIDTRPGGTVCASTGAAHSWTVNLDSTPVVGVEEVTVKLQVQNSNGTYSTAGSKHWVL